MQYISQSFIFRESILSFLLAIYSVRIKFKDLSYFATVLATTLFSYLVQNKALLDCMHSTVIKVTCRLFQFGYIFLTIFTT